MSDPAADLLADLTPSQQAAVKHGEGPLLILAGAGSGKTRVITRRVAYLLRQGVRPSSILAITFTNKAAGEMKNRVEQLVPGNRVWVSTFHSLGARLLRQYADRLNIDKNFTIYDVDDRNKLVKEALDALNLDSVKFTPERIAGAISKAKNQLLTPAGYERTANDFFTQTAAKVYHGYEKRLRAANGMDFDDLLYLPAMALKLNEEFRADLDARFRYVLIDEYQDTNQAQYEIARRLSIHHPNLCVVGDPDQCLLPGTMVDTPNGPRAIETLKDGDTVHAAAGGGEVENRVADKIMVNPYRGSVLRIEMENGTVLKATPNHVCFARDSRCGTHDLGVDFGPERLVLSAQAEGLGRGSPHYPRSALKGSFAKVRLSVPFRDENEASPDPGLRPGLTETAFQAEEVARHSSELFDFVVDNEPFSPMAAACLQPGMLVPVRVGGVIRACRIARISREDYAGPVYDVSVPERHNFIANGVVVHNSIYKWRGSDIKNILDFERDFPAATVITLEKNYRSTKAILHAASVVIDHNKQRKKKTLTTDNPAGDPVTVLTFDNGLDEAEGVVVRIKDAVRAGKLRYRDHAIFLRINALTRSLESAFVKHGVPFQIVKGLAFFDRKENKDVLAYLRLLVNPNDSVGFFRVVNEPARGIGKVSLDRLAKFAESHEISPLEAAGRVHQVPDIKGKAATGLRDFFRLISDLRAHLGDPPHELIRLVLDKSGYRAALAESKEEDDADRLANIEELVTAAKQFHDEDNARTLADFLEQIALASDVDGWDENTDHVSVMTLHSAKGLEFPVVYVLAMEQGLLPHERSLAKDEDVEEERRLCFVGMTRAMRELYLTHARLREFRGQALYAVPSMFLEELPPEARHVDVSAFKNVGRTAMDEWRAKSSAAALNAGYGSRKPEPVKPGVAAGDGSYSVGQVVQHDEYGIGQIVDVGGLGALRKVRIRFAKAGEKTFVADKVKLKVVTKK